MVSDDNKFPNGVLVIPISKREEPKESYAIVTDAPVPEGKVRLDNGKLMDRADVACDLFRHNDDPTRFIAKDGVEYRKMPNGSLKRISPKKSELRHRH